MNIKGKNLREKIMENFSRGLVAVAILSLNSCGYLNTNRINSYEKYEDALVISEIEPVCRHTATMCGLAYREKYEKVEIAFGPKIYKHDTINQGLWHAQAKVKINGEWKWISFSKKENKCYMGELENFRETDSCSVEDYINYRLPKVESPSRNFVERPRLR